MYCNEYEYEDDCGEYASDGGGMCSINFNQQLVAIAIKPMRLHPHYHHYIN